MNIETLYQEHDLPSLTAQLRKRCLLWALPALLLLALLVYSLFPRLQWLTVLASFLLFSLVFFALSMHLLPLRRYRSFVHNAIHGKKSQAILHFDSLDEQVVEREGLMVHMLNMLDEGAKEGLKARQYYWDANLEKPSFETGRRYELHSHEKVVTGWRQI